MQHCSAVQVQQQLRVQTSTPWQLLPSRNFRQRSHRCCTCAAMAGAGCSPDAGAAYKDRVRDMWRWRGPGYDVNNALHPPLCRELVQLAEVPPGATVLDVCCGTGTVAFDAAMQAGPAGKVLGIDISEAMLEQVRSLSSWVHCRRADLHSSAAGSDLVDAPRWQPWHAAQQQGFTADQLCMRHMSCREAQATDQQRATTGMLQLLQWRRPCVCISLIALESVRIQAGVDVSPS